MVNPWCWSQHFLKCTDLHPKPHDVLQSHILKKYRRICQLQFIGTFLISCTFFRYFCSLVSCFLDSSFFKCCTFGFAPWGLHLKVCTLRFEPWGLHLEVCNLRFEPWGLYLQVCTWNLHLQIYTFILAPLHLKVCTCRLPPSGLHSEVYTQRFAPRGLHLKLYTQRFAPKGLHLQVCTNMFAPAGLDQYLCTLRFAPIGCAPLVLKTSGTLELHLQFLHSVFLDSCDSLF